MTEGVEIRVKVRALLRKEGRLWVAGAPTFGVFSQGPTREGAKEALREALGLWIESCVERGTLDQALREVGFRPAAWGGEDAPEKVQVTVRKPVADSILGAESEIEVSIPAYQAAALLQLPGNSLSF